MDREASESSSESGNDMRYDREDDQWLDAEPDGEVLDIVSLFDDQKFSDAKSMLNYCKEKFGFDFIDVQRRLSMIILFHVYLIVKNCDIKLTIFRPRLLWPYKTRKLCTYGSGKRQSQTRCFYYRHLSG
jgi:hypothetical protein